MRSQLLVRSDEEPGIKATVSGPWLETSCIYSTWNVPSFFSLPSIHNMHLVWWLFVLLEFKQRIWSILGMYNLSWRTWIFSTSHCLPFLIHLLNTLQRHLFIFEGAWSVQSVSLCPVRQTKFIVIALLLYNKFLADIVIYFNMLCNHF